MRFTLTDLNIRGAGATSKAILKGAFDAEIGKTLAVGSICELRDHAARLLFGRGVLARVEIPEQRIDRGELTLEVIEAHVVNVRVRGDAGHAQSAVERYVNRLRGMSPFDLRKAQRYLLLASDVPGVQIRAAIRPSTTGERGAVDIEVTVIPQPIVVSSNVQNYGSKEVGRWTALVRADAGSLTDFADRTSLIYSHTIDNDEQSVVQMLEELRVGDDGMVVKGSYVYGVTNPGETLKTLALKSVAEVAEVEADYPLVRTRFKNLNLAGGFDLIDETTAAGGASLYDNRLRIFFARLSGDEGFSALGRPVQFSGAVAIREGSGLFGGSRSDSTNLTRPEGDPDAWLVRANASASTFPVDKLQVAVQVQSQYTRDKLLDYEQLSLGGLTVGRGYDPGVVLGDSGVACAVDIRYGPFPVTPTVRLKPYIFYDVGSIYNNGSDLVTHRLIQSAGIGTGFLLYGRANLDVAYAKPFTAVAPGLPRPTARILVNLTAAFL